MLLKHVGELGAYWKLEGKVENQKEKKCILFYIYYEEPFYIFLCKGTGWPIVLSLNIIALQINQWITTYIFYFWILW